ncbi:hypothetical protein D3C71_741010 [compost metagenome]
MPAKQRVIRHGDIAVCRALVAVNHQRALVNLRCAFIRVIAVETRQAAAVLVEAAAAGDRAAESLFFTEIDREQTVVENAGHVG